MPKYGERPVVRIGECDVGRGLFASRAISEGEVILRFDGPMLSLADVRAKGPLAANALQIGADRYLDLAEPGRLVNHSCVPNAGIRDDVMLVAIRGIPDGEEIRFDYSTTIGDFWNMSCHCGAPTCRGIVASFASLPADLRSRYARLGIVQRFLRAPSVMSADRSPNDRVLPTQRKRVEGRGG
jgi:hypothetical protein